MAEYRNRPKLVELLLMRWDGLTRAACAAFARGHSAGNRLGRTQRLACAEEARSKRAGRVRTEKLLPVFRKFKKRPKRSTVSSVWRVFEFLPKPGTNPKGWSDVLHWHGCRHCYVIRAGDLVGRARAPAAVRGLNSFY